MFVKKVCMSEGVAGADGVPCVKIGLLNKPSLALRLPQLSCARRNFSTKTAFEKGASGELPEGCGEHADPSVETSMLIKMTGRSFRLV